jgi:2-phospho-L-lactate/phosphoenolpyruvate guanylyltransferase
VLVPVKGFDQAKARLSGLLSPGQRRELAGRMAARVVAAGAPLPVFVVCDDLEVAGWAEAHGATPLLRPGRGLNGAVESGVAALRERGFDVAVVAHSDLPLAADLAMLAPWPGVTLVPDRRDDGTNVAVVPSGVGFRFAYGAASFRRHGAEATRLGLSLRVVRQPHLGWDVDVPDDLDFADFEAPTPLGGRCP